jgi:hypothetical protein
MPPDETLLHDDPGLDGGEWLFRRDGQVFGPVDSRALAAMLYRGEVDGRTQVSPGDGSWSGLGQIPVFVVHVKKAEVGLRVEAEVTGSRVLRARAQRRRLVGIGVAAVLLVAGAAGGALVLARRSAETSPLLEDFGAGIRIASAARVGVSRRAAQEDEFEVPADSRQGGGAAPARKRPRPAPAPGAPATGAVEGGEIVAASFDARKIQAVVGREQRGLAPCFREEAQRSPGFRGDVPIEFAIGNDGRVSQLWIDEPRFREGPLRECLLRALAGWRFDPFPGQRPTVSLAFGIGR